MFTYGKYSSQEFIKYIQSYQKVPSTSLCANPRPVLAGIQAMGGEERRGETTAWDRPHPRPALLPQLRPDLVRHNEARRRPLQDPLLCALPGPHTCPWAALQLHRLRQILQLPRRE